MIGYLRINKVSDPVPVIGVSHTVWPSELILTGCIPPADGVSDLYRVKFEPMDSSPIEFTYGGYGYFTRTYTILELV